MPCKPRWKALTHGQSCKNRRVARAARDHHVRASVERSQKGLGPHHPDEMLAAVDDRAIECRCRVERLYAALAQPLIEKLLGLLRMNQCEPERQFFLAGNFLRDVERPVEMNVCPGCASRADEEGNAEPARAEQHEPQIAFHCHAGKRGLARAEVARAGIGRAGVATDEVRPRRERSFEGRFDKAGAENPGGRQDPHLVHCRSRCAPAQERRSASTG